MIPLSTRMRPQTIEEFQGQEHFLYPGSLFYNSIKNKTFDSAIFFGPPGCGKTTLARIIAREMDGNFCEINASVAGTKELKELIQRAKDSFYGFEKKATYVYIDEFHRWNKLQQDSLLKALEEGVIKFIGSTTENPYFAVNNAIISRVRNIYEFKRLSIDNLIKIIENAINDRDRGVGALNIKWDQEAIAMMAEFSGGDARIALDTVGFIADNLQEDKLVTQSVVKEAMQRKTIFYDNADDKYNLLSALQKSVRGSDPDAAVHYLARLINGGADIQMIGRRLLVMASEDVGMAYPSAVSIVTACVQAALMVGLPEAVVNLSHAVVLMAASPKSNAAYKAYIDAMTDINDRQIDDVPDHLKDAHYEGAQKMGLGKEYKYPHDYGGYVKQQYLPDNLYEEGVKYYKPTDNGSEITFKKFLESLDKKQ
jgi:putative ATPase